MSGHSYSTTCPVCGEEMDTYNDYKPFEYTTHECLDCGFYTTVNKARLDFEELNLMREDREMEKLTKKEYNKYKKKDFDF